MTLTGQNRACECSRTAQISRVKISTIHLVDLHHEALSVSLAIPLPITLLCCRDRIRKCLMRDALKHHRRRQIRDREQRGRHSRDRLIKAGWQFHTNRRTKSSTENFSSWKMYFWFLPKWFWSDFSIKTLLKHRGSPRASAATAVTPHKPDASS